ncbi:hypothetical protein NEUTE1DRAFT_117588 [Neurospora tetrasperma FGSC 2508]|uniref:Uncharacterized protein n=1 Tax=Neurospora tetrasperma (strain FGSC 2508 / ATCC MYA-4615 / P0657) TaxID=510951 RepID=F8MPG2_NEUT8|nr:uncharacterized protein NEUTE1DRAFT_117588 [Neurospora tetrasperma FGSC 2508]EGO57121.1 hypothetical protein NEUTE1DRAFT_117588 [Neurospora tetrasperma FGSC 2508]EGZ69960.1 hypothetical protein NEUTE2DRAFT_144895 [Neurospora tetrasperma FGSC 2509]
MRTSSLFQLNFLPSLARHVQLEKRHPLPQDPQLAQSVNKPSQRPLPLPS